MSSRILVALSGLALIGLGPPAPLRAADTVPEGQLVEDGPYQQGKVRVGVGGGAVSNGSNWNFGLSVSVGVFVIENLEVAADGAFQFGDDPFAAYLGPGIKYLFPVDPSVHPYIGTFYRHWFFSEGLPDADSVGARAGIVVRTGSVFFGLGGVYETIVSDCEGEGCTSFYPELGLSVLL